MIVILYCSTVKISAQRPIRISAVGTVHLVVETFTRQTHRQSDRKAERQTDRRKKKKKKKKKIQ